MVTALPLLLTLLHPTAASDQAPDLCADVYLKPTGEPLTDFAGRTVARFCDWDGPDSPIWSGNVCCSVDELGALCSAPGDHGRCSSGMKMHCDYGEEFSDGTVVCYQSFPSACEFGSCEGPSDIQSPDYIQDDLLCCQNGDCYEWNMDYFADCEGYLSWCSSGYLKEDGTVDCWD